MELQLDLALDLAATVRELEDVSSSSKSLTALVSSRLASRASASWGQPSSLAKSAISAREIAARPSRASAALIPRAPSSALISAAMAGSFSRRVAVRRAPPLE